MGCDAIRTSHNMPAPELVRLCDEMGFMMMVEPFDEWDIRKCRNGYHLFFDEWAEKDMVNMLHQFRNDPAVVFWSIGNEVPSQCSESGYETAKFLVDICHREDPTRFTTCGMDQVLCVLKNGLAGLLDVPGFNYRVHLYEQAYETLPHKIVLGSETASTISSRGVYYFPVEKTARVQHEDLQCSSYDLEYCGWSNVPDIDFAMAADKEWEIGQFVSDDDSGDDPRQLGVVMGLRDERGDFMGRPRRRMGKHGRTEYLCDLEHACIELEHQRARHRCDMVRSGPSAGRRRQHADLWRI